MEPAQHQAIQAPKLPSFSPFQLIGFMRDLLALYQELEEDGTIKELIEAEEKVRHHIEHNERLKKFLAKIDALTPNR